MPRPSKLNAETMTAILDRIGAGASRVEAARAADLGARTLHEWISRGRAGERPFDAFARAVDAETRRARGARCEANSERRKAAERERWQRFRASREAWYLARLGPAEFWRRRLVWLADKGHTAAFGRLVAKLRAEGWSVRVGQ